MTTLDSLKTNLRNKARAISSGPKQSLSHAQYSAGFDVFAQGLKTTTYESFIMPQLKHLFESYIKISVLEIGPGPKSVLGALPHHSKCKIERYVAFEPNDLFAESLEKWLSPSSATESPLPCLKHSPIIHRTPFTPEYDQTTSSRINHDDRFDIILFCHSMYGMTPKSRFMERALEMLSECPDDGIAVVFHRDGDLFFDGLVCHQQVSFPGGVVQVATDDETLDRFASFMAGFTFQDSEADKTVRSIWRKQCREFGRREQAHPGHLLFSAPNIMVTFTKHATALPELKAQIPFASRERKIKSHQARFYHPAAIVRPTKVEHIQQCVRWALKYKASLTVIGGSHSGQCLQSNVVSIDMSAFDKIHTAIAKRKDEEPSSSPTSMVVVESGCNAGDVVRETMAVGTTVPLGARPSVGSGLWLQGGVGHLARLHGLSCDAIVGAVLVSVASGQAVYVGSVPSQYRPAGAVRPKHEADLLWALKGAGTNFGIVVSVVFRTFPAPMYSVWNWNMPLEDSSDALLKLRDFNQVAEALPRTCSADVYLYSDNGNIQLGITLIQCSTLRLPSQLSESINSMLGPEDSFKIVDGVGLFDTEMYICGMHGGHGGGKTSSFKRCLFLKHIGAANVARILIEAIETRPSPSCYLHLLHGAGAVSDVADDDTAFGCRDWDFACVITAVWPRDQSVPGSSQAAIQWVYNVAGSLLPNSRGVYGADLGPDPRDTSLAAKAFGRNGQRLARLKVELDPHNVLAYACPVPKLPKKQKLIILVTGESGVGKDYCADIWVPMLAGSTNQHYKVHRASISDTTKREYAAASGADLNRLLKDRAYKEQHRPALTAFFEHQMQQQPLLAKKHFLNLVSDSAEADVVVITGMRDGAPLATLSHLVPNDRLLDIRVIANEDLRQTRLEHQCGGSYRHNNQDWEDVNRGENGNWSQSNSMTLDYCPSFVVANEVAGNDVIKRFADMNLLPFLH
ncbi:hypothetical protein F53441_5348 [Fusarium austroafricanum]|uniref:FAD-binding PCMH-type domain-containing protein n=1 Tax=Fusarium austroafricanum TaxID=2364996 RepID=A0A8H4KL55_9HYPO|nr:hypothetical protein F53441_5348 [Fusarium austroafricanum]